LRLPERFFHCYRIEFFGPTSQGLGIGRLTNFECRVQTTQGSAIFGTGPPKSPTLTRETQLEGDTEKQIVLIIVTAMRVITSPCWQLAAYVKYFHKVFQKQNTKYFCKSISNTNTKYFIHKVFHMQNTQLYFVLTSCARGDTICPCPACCTHASAHLQSIAYTPYACGAQRALLHEYS